MIRLPHVNLIDEDPRREIAVQVNSADRLSYLLRLKLHHLDGRTSSYQTQTVIDFELQKGVTQTFPSYEEVRLEAGYAWDAKTRTMGAPVISLRHGRNRVIWVHQLSPGQGGAAGSKKRRYSARSDSIRAYSAGGGGGAERESDDRTGNRPDMSGFGDLISTARLARGLTQAQLAAMIDVTQPALHRYEHGLRDPEPEILARLADVLGVTQGVLAARGQNSRGHGGRCAHEAAGDGEGYDLASP